MRVVELPVGASEDRVVGSIDIEAAIREGNRRFEPGLLAEANRNLLYVDEVNLLDDHLVDVLLDAAAMGVNTVEREGVSFTRPSALHPGWDDEPGGGELGPSCSTASASRWTWWQASTWTSACGSSSRTGPRPRTRQRSRALRTPMSATSPGASVPRKSASRSLG